MDHVFSTSVYGLSAMHEGHELNGETHGAVIFNTDRENKLRLVRCLLYLLEIELP